MMRRSLMMVLLFTLFSAWVMLPSPLHTDVYADDTQDTGAGQANGPESPSPSTATMQTQTTGGSKVTCDTLPEAQGGVLIGKIVPCLVYTIQQSTVQFTADMVSWLEPIMYTFLLLVVVFFGLRVLQNEPQIYKQGFLLLVKIAIVGTILADLGNTEAYDGSGSQGQLIPAVYGVMSDMQAVVAGAITTTNLHCDVSKFQGPQTPAVWAMMDCVMGKLYGFTVSGTGGKPSMLLMTSVAGLLTGFLFGGAWGVTVFFAMVGVLLTMFRLIIQTVVGFLTGYLIVCILLILAPLFLPLAFLRGTAPYYESYTRSMVAAFLTPVIITAYTMFALIVYDQILFAPNSIVQTLFTYDSIKNAVLPPKKGCDLQIVNDPTATRSTTAAPTDTDKDSILGLLNMKNYAFPTLGGGNDLCNVVKFPNFELDKVTGMVVGKDKEEMTQIFMQLVELFIVAYLISLGETQLPDIVSQLVGKRSAIQGTQAIMGNSKKFSDGYQSAVRAATKRFQKDPNDPDAGYKSGGQYVKDLPRDLPGAMGDAGKKFFDTLKE